MHLSATKLPFILTFLSFLVIGSATPLPDPDTAPAPVCEGGDLFVCDLFCGKDYEVCLTQRTDDECKPVKKACTANCNKACESLIKPRSLQARDTCYGGNVAKCGDICDETFNACTQGTDSYEECAKDLSRCSKDCTKNCPILNLPVNPRNLQARDDCTGGDLEQCGIACVDKFNLCAGVDTGCYGKLRTCNEACAKDCPVPIVERRNLQVRDDCEGGNLERCNIICTEDFGACFGTGFGCAGALRSCQDACTKSCPAPVHPVKPRNLLARGPCNGGSKVACGNKCNEDFFLCSEYGGLNCAPQETSCLQSCTNNCGPITGPV